jgi:hypothetical protein
MQNKELRDRPRRRRDAKVTQLWHTETHGFAGEKCRTTTVSPMCNAQKRRLAASGNWLKSASRRGCSFRCVRVVRRRERERAASGNP